MEDCHLIENFCKEDLYEQLSKEIQFVPRHLLTFSIFGRTFELPRDKAFYGTVNADGSTPLYRYGGAFYPQVLPWTPLLQLLRDQLERETGYNCNHAVINRYKSGKDHIRFHHDKVRDFQDGMPVCTLSFGGTRTLCLKKDLSGKQVKFILSNGSLFVLGLQTNKEWKHKIAKTATTCEPRISITFRCIKTMRSKEGQVYVSVLFLLFLEIWRHTIILILVFVISKQLNKYLV